MQAIVLASVNLFITFYYFFFIIALALLTILQLHVLQILEDNNLSR